MYEFDDEKHIEKILSSYSARAVMKEKSAEDYKRQDWRRRGVVLSCGRHREKDRRGNETEPPKAERRRFSRRHKAASDPASSSYRILVVALKDRGDAAFHPKPGDEVFVEHAHPESEKKHHKPPVDESVQGQTPGETNPDRNRDYVVHLSGKPPAEK